VSKYHHNRALKILFFIGLVGFGHLSRQLVDINIFDYDSYSIYARFNLVAGLEVGDPVKMHGLKIGRVADLQESNVDLTLKLHGLYVKPLSSRRLLQWFC
jgi:ABC-type transporter Mla subunit MlaD